MTSSSVRQRKGFRQIVFELQNEYYSHAENGSNHMQRHAGMMCTAVMVCICLLVSITASGKACDAPVRAVLNAYVIIGACWLASFVYYWRFPHSCAQQRWDEATIDRAKFMGVKGFFRLLHAEFREMQQSEPRVAAITLLVSYTFDSVNVLLAPSFIFSAPAPCWEGALGLVTNADCLLFVISLFNLVFNLGATAVMFVLRTGVNRPTSFQEIEDMEMAEGDVDSEEELLYDVDDDGHLARDFNFNDEEGEELSATIEKELASVSTIPEPSGGCGFLSSSELESSSSDQAADRRFSFEEDEALVTSPAIADVAVGTPPAMTDADVEL